MVIQHLVLRYEEIECVSMRNQKIAMKHLRKYGLLGTRHSLIGKWLLDGQGQTMQIGGWLT
jgi:hypothetical protein